MDTKLALFWDWVDQEAKSIKSDGCSGVPDFYLKCCKVHDLAYYYAKDPQSAYKHYYLGTEDYWGAATSITQKDADQIMRRCIQECSKLGRFSPMSWWRYAALRKFGKKAWNSHAATHKV